MNSNKYFGKFFTYCNAILHFSISLFTKGFLLSLLLVTVLDFELKAQDNYIDETGVTPFVYDQIPVLVLVEGYKNFYVDVIYTSNDVLYVNIEDLFRSLSMPCINGQGGNSLSGFIEKETRTYSIEYTTRQIKVGDKTINTRNGLVYEMGSLYMESSLFSQAFGISLTFNFRSLSIILKSNFELPVIKQMRIEKMRENMSKVKGEETADTVLTRNFHLLRLGTLDWSFASFQSINGHTDNRFGLGVGTELFSGEADASLVYYDRQKFDNRQLQYMWRWVDNDRKIIKQAKLGRIYDQTISFIDAPLIGAAVRNSPTTVRKATGYYSINESTEPNWTVELYINNVLVDYTKADASGLFNFKVPVVYGYTMLKLIFYGTMGEQRTEERTMNVPYTVMPAKEFEYGLAAGFVQDRNSSRFARGEFNYGVNRILTVGGGLEYLSSIPNGSSIPFVKATLQPHSKLVLTGEYAHGVKTMGLLDYYFWKDASLEIDYTKYVEGQMATRFNAPEERNAKLSVPFRYKTSNGYVKFDLAQFVYKEFVFNQANLILSSYYKQFSGNSSVQLNWIENKSAYVTVDLALSCRLNNGITIRPSARYNLCENSFMSYKAAVEKSIPRGNISVTYERNVLAKNNFVSLNFKYDLAFARANINATHSDNKFTVSESAQGSLAFGSGNKYISGNNNASVGKGGISLFPFLDLNQNGIFDKNEHMVKLPALKVFGGKAIFNPKDSVVRIADLNAFTNYIVEFADKDLENVAWRFKNKRYQVLIDPNQFKRVDIPIISVGEVSGMAYLNTDNTLKGIGRILVKFYKKNSSNVVAETLSESDGFIYYLGLDPGEYVARIDSAQLSNLEFTPDPIQIAFSIRTTEEGDIISGINFVLNTKKNVFLQKKYKEEEIKSELIKDRTDAGNAHRKASSFTEKNTEFTKKQFLLAEGVSIMRDTLPCMPGDTLYRIHLLTIRVPIRVNGYFMKLLNDISGLKITELEGGNGLYYYSTGSFRGIEQAREFLELIKKSGWMNCFIVASKSAKSDETIFKLQHIKANQ
jgi:hypothetical protein